MSSGVHKQNRDKDGQPILTERKCPHGIFRDDRGNVCCESCLEVGRTNSYLLGIAVGWEQASEEFTKRAGEAFSAGKDEKAHFFRDMAKLCKEASASRRKDFEKHKREYGDGVTDDPDNDPFAKADEDATF
jgi:uncharacterized protein YeaO (DUF488 family)